MVNEKFTISLKTLVVSSLAATAVAAMLTLMISASYYQSLLYENKNNSIVELVDLQAQNILSSLIAKTMEVGMNLQTRQATRETILSKDAHQLTQILDGQFHQYIVSSGALAPQRLYAFDTEYNLIAKSSEGYHLADDSRYICSALLNRARSRKGAERLKPITEVCVEEDHAFLAVMITVATFKPLGYLLMVVDPAVSLGKLEEGLGIPVRVAHPSGKTAYVSASWTEHEGEGDFEHHLPATHALKNGRGEVYARIDVLQQIEGFQSKLQETTRYSVASSMAVFCVFLLLLLFVLNSGLKALTRLKEGADRFRRGQFTAIEPTRFHEINSLLDSFNSMATSISALIEDLRIARKEADRANNSKSTFLANMSHEIRTPMNAILGYAQILKRDANLSGKQLAAVETVMRSGNHLLSLINDILDISKIEAGRMQLVPTDFDLKSLIEDLGAMFQFRCEEKGINWGLHWACSEEHVVVHGDENKLRQVLINLVGNAVKFTQQGAVNFRVAARGNDCYLFEVADTGPGISEDMQQRIFEAFTQDEGGIKHGGTGLGLAIAKRQVELMGGDLSVVSALGKGARFQFELRLPASKFTQKALRSRSSAVQLRPDAHLSALIVDDNALNRDVLRECVGGIGVVVREAEDAFKGLEDLETNGLPDFVFMDYRMPGMDGIQATKEIRRLHGDNVKIIMISASAYEHQTSAFTEAGADAYIKKPFTFEEVLEVLANLIGDGFEMADEPDAAEQSENAVSEAEAKPAKDLRELSAGVEPELLDRISELAEFGMVSKLRDEIAALQEKHGELAGHLQGLLDDLELDEIANMTREACQ